MRGSRFVFMNITLALFAAFNSYRNFVGTVAGYFDDRLRTDDGAGSAACAFTVIRLSGEITIFVGYFGDDDRFLGAYDYTQAAALASLGINNDFPGHLDYIYCVLLRIVLSLWDDLPHKQYSNTVPPLL